LLLTGINSDAIICSIDKQNQTVATMGTATLLDKSADKWNDKIVGSLASQSEDSVKARMMQELLDDLRTMPDKLFRRNSLYKERLT